MPNSSGACSVWVCFTENLEQAPSMVSHTCNSVLGKRQEDHEKFKASPYTQQIPGYSWLYCKGFAQRGKMNMEENLAFLFP